MRFSAGALRRIVSRSGRLAPWGLALVLGLLLPDRATAQVGDPDYCIDWKGATPQVISPSLTSWGSVGSTQLDQGYVVRTLTFTLDNPDNQNWAMCIRGTTNSNLGTYGSGSGSKLTSDLQWRLVSVTGGNVSPFVTVNSPSSTSFASILCCDATSWRFVVETSKQSGGSSTLAVTLEFRMLLGWNDEPGSYGLPIELSIGHRETGSWGTGY